MPDIEKHLHQISTFIRDQDSIKLVVRLESSYVSKVRYLAVVSCIEQDAEEFCLLGVDCDQNVSVGLVLSILSYTTIRLDGDGGFCVTTGDGLRSHIFKPVSVQTMWSALQSLYRASECAKENNSFQASAVRYYEDVFTTHKSDTSCLNEWNILPGVENRRPLTSYYTSEELSFQEKISCTLREILLCERDLDDVTSKEIRTKLEFKLNLDLSNYKSFIDEEMLKILGQMEAPALILDHLFLGTEWNASHQQDLFDKNINNILNVTTEIDNFFPDTFRYMNIPVCDTEETDILRYFNDSYRFISKARKDGKNVLVHCKMGISRSATIVIAYVMKTRNWDLYRSLKHVQERRNCVKPNPNFMKQLEVYEGILTAKRFSTTLEKRSKSESNLKQNDKSLLLAPGNERTMCSSNSDITDGGVEIKTHKKYFNTAPARLKPEKNGRKLTDILKPKSSSCAAIISDKPEFDDIVSSEVMSSFEAAVSVLETSSTSTSSNFYLGSKESPLTKSTASMDIPVVTITNEDGSGSHPLSVTDDKMMITSSTSDEPVFQQVNPLQSTIPIPPPPPMEDFLMDIGHLQDTTGDSESGDGPSTKKFMSLKCCRRPYNGHTFSVSPNQVVNITSVVDSKFSVRHLVNEFELQSKGSSSSTESTNAFETLSHKPVKSPRRTKTRPQLQDTCDTDYTSSEDNQESESLPVLSKSLEAIRTPPFSTKSTKKADKLGCLPFFRKYSSSMSKSSPSKNAVSPGGGNLKKSVGEKSRDKLKDKGASCKGKILETVAKLSESGDSISPLEPLPSKYHSTGVVKQRLEAFEAKAVIPHHSKHHLFFRSHNRSHSATGATGSAGSLTFESLSHLSQRKSSMPHLESRGGEFDSSSFSRLPVIPHMDRKSSLDSNGLFKSLPCPMVRGFQTSSGSKSFFSTSPNAGSRVQHGQTHPLSNLLPRTPTLT